MPSRAWVVTISPWTKTDREDSFNALSGLSCYWKNPEQNLYQKSFNALSGLSCYRLAIDYYADIMCFNALSGLSCYS